jgi:hypothetical protein
MIRLARDLRARAARARGARLALALVVAAGGALAAPRAARAEANANLDSYIEVLRSDVRTRKAAILAESMRLDEAQAKVFWPLQREYEGELADLMDERLQLIKDYAASWPELDDRTAEGLAKRALDLEARRVDLRKKYYRRVEKALSPRIAARFLQIEGALGHVVDLQIASQLPLVP